MKNIFLIPGFMSTQLAIISTGEILWWDVDSLVFYGPGKLRLAANGIDPGPPDGVPMGLEGKPSYPWDFVMQSLSFQLDMSVWRLGYLPWDWRKDPTPLAATLAQNIRDTSTPAQPATLVAHSAGGILAVLAWANLNASGDGNKVRRIITLGTPFQGSYATVDFLAGTSTSDQQLLNIGQVFQAYKRGTSTQFSQPNLNKLALTWPNFYFLLPALGGSEAAKDPNRVLLYDASNYPAPTAPSQAWLDYARNTFQPALANPATFPPQWIATYVWGTGVYTWEALGNGNLPIEWDTRIRDADGDGVVMAGSADRSPGKRVSVPGAHASLPFGLAVSGLLAELILDERRPPDPPPPFTGSKVVITANTTDAPEEDPISATVCIGGHC